MFTPSYDSITFIDGPFGWHIPRWPAHSCWVYLIHFSVPYFHAQHYLGSTAGLESRLQLHRNGNGARLMEVVSDAGISWEVARLWKCETYEEARALERKLKHAHGHGPALCPICRGKPLDVYTALRQGHWPIALHDQVGRRRPLGRW